MFIRLSSRSDGATRQGAILMEVLVAAAVLAVLLTISLRMFAVAALGRRAVEKRAVALQEAAGAMERATALPWNELTAERLDEIGLSPSSSGLLKDAALRWTIEPAGSEPPARHLRLELTWQLPEGGTSQPVRLNAWVYAPPSTSGDVP